MIYNDNPVQHKLRKIHPNLESQIKYELSKLLKARIIFTIRHSKWVSNLVPVKKKNRDIHKKRPYPIMAVRLRPVYKCLLAAPTSNSANANLEQCNLVVWSHHASSRCSGSLLDDA